MKDRKYSVMDRTAAAAFAIVLGISGIWGLKEQENAPGKNRTAMVREAADPADMATDSVEESGAAQNAAGRAFRESAAVILDEKQMETVSDIMAALEKGNLKEAATVMEHEEDMLADMFYTAMDGVRYLFDGSSFQADIDGRGMVFTKAGTVYYGTFKAGKPEGQCTALQVVDLDAPRYDYSQGIWKDGRMEGKGHTGYCYFERSPEGEARDICKTGTFSQDLMEGDVVYTSMNEEDQVSTWKLKVEHGIAIMDDRWDYVESTGEYQLLSEDNDNHAYVVEEDQAAMPMWVNLLIWDE